MQYENAVTGWETKARPLANASENLAGQVENRPGRVEFCKGYIRDYPVQASSKKFLVAQPELSISSTDWYLQILLW